MRRLASIPEEDQRPPMFWKVMIYACDRCGFEIEFYLEEGCEGPEDVERAAPPQLVEAWKKDRPSGLPPLPEAVPFTASGRVCVPVPFVAVGCPKCQPTPPWSLSRGCLQHVRWNEDRKLSPAVSLPARVQAQLVSLGFVERHFAPHFRYPAAAGIDPMACGVPNVPWAPRTDPTRPERRA